MAPASLSAFWRTCVRATTAYDSKRVGMFVFLLSFFSALFVGWAAGALWSSVTGAGGDPTTLTLSEGVVITGTRYLAIGVLFVGISYLVNRSKM